MINEAVFLSLYERTKNNLWGYLHNMLKDASLADDMLQETYIRFLHSNAEYVDDKDKKSYLYKIATNLMNDYWRKKRREGTSLSLEKNEITSESQEREIGLRNDVGKAFQQLPLQQQSLLWLAYVEGYKHKEIAGMLNVREQSVKVLLFRAKQTLGILLRQIGMETK